MGNGGQDKPANIEHWRRAEKMPSAPSAPSGDRVIFRIPCVRAAW
jgi:hypothetical protein